MTLSCDNFRSMMNSYIQYNKMRRPASKQSVRRAKQLVDESGGVTKLLSMVHPGLIEIAAKRGLSTNSNVSISDGRSEKLGFFNDCRKQARFSI